MEVTNCTFYIKNGIQPCCFHVAVGWQEVSFQVKELDKNGKNSGQTKISNQNGNDAKKQLSGQEKDVLIPYFAIYRLQNKD